MGTTQSHYNKTMRNLTEAQEEVARRKKSALRTWIICGIVLAVIVIAEQVLIQTHMIRRVDSVVLIVDMVLTFGICFFAMGKWTKYSSAKMEYKELQEKMDAVETPHKK